MRLLQVAVLPQRWRSSPPKAVACEAMKATGPDKQAVLPDPIVVAIVHL